MKVYSTLEHSKGYEHWKASLNYLGPEMKEVGIMIVFLVAKIVKKSRFTLL